MKRIIGITGGIATGKSTVSSYLLQQGYLLADCDKLTRQAYVDCFDDIKNAFPDCVVDGEISRPKLGARVFSNDKDKSSLEAIIHPYVLKRMKEMIDTTKEGLIFLDIPLLFEAHMEDLCDEIWVIYVSENLQLERLMNRNQLTQQEALIRMNAQMSIEEKRKKADVVIDNSTTLDNLYIQIQKRLEELNDIINEPRHLSSVL